MKITNKRAFTLAEVLITLGIIGVVAAMTIPAVVSHSTNQKFIAGAKKAFNTLKMVQRQAEVEQGRMDSWAEDNTNALFSKNFLTHFDIIDDCGTSGGCFTASIKPPTGEEISTTDFYTITAADGISYAYDATNKRIYADVNSLDEPNTLGRDVFAFEVLPDEGGIKPGGFGIEDSKIKSECQSTGIACTSIVINKSAMNY